MRVVTQSSQHIKSNNVIEHSYWGDEDECIHRYYDKLDVQKISDNQVITVDGENIEILTAK